MFKKELKNSKAKSIDEGTKIRVHKLKDAFFSI